MPILESTTATPSLGVSVDVGHHDILGTYTISGLADGTYELFSSIFPGLNPSRPSPSVTVAGGSGTKNFTFQALTGQVNI